MTTLPYTLDPDDPAVPPLGLIVLQADETIEPEFRRAFAGHPSPLYVSRIPSAPDVTPDTLTAMKADLPAAAGLLPRGLSYAAVGYGCTSASSLIGPAKVAELVRSACDARAVTDPLTAATAHAAHLGVSRFALLSPYIESVNEPLRAAFARYGLSMDIFATFGIADEATVVRLSQASIIEAALRLSSDPNVEALFLSCTNLRTIDAIPIIEAECRKPVLSSNRSLAWHMQELARQ